MKHIPQIQPYFDEKEMHHLKEVMESTFITENSKTEEFLTEIRGLTKSNFALAVANGTLALVASLLAEGIGKEDEVIVPNLTFIASANAVRLVGATPVFCDVDYPSGCMTSKHCEELLSSKTRAIMPVHLYNNVADMADLLRFAKAHSLCVIEDAAEAFGASRDGQHAGTFGDYGIFSFFANKSITCGEGGVILTNEESRYTKLYRAKNHGRDRRGTFIHEHFGYNFCFTDLQAAIGVAQLEKLELIKQKKKLNFDTYQSAFDGKDNVQLIDPEPGVKSNYWFNNILVDNPTSVMENLATAGIETRRIFYPLHRQPCYENTEAASIEFPNSDRLYDHGLSLPSSAALTEEDLQYVCQETLKACKN